MPKARNWCLCLLTRSSTSPFPLSIELCRWPGAVGIELHPCACGLELSSAACAPPPLEGPLSPSPSSCPPHVAESQLPCEPGKECLLADRGSGLCCLAELLTLASNGTLDQQVGDQAGVGQGGLGDRRGVLPLQPLCNGGPLIGMPIPGYHWVHHHPLHAAGVSCYNSTWSCREDMGARGGEKGGSG